MKAAAHALAIVVMWPLIAVGFVAYVAWHCLSLGWYGGAYAMERFAASVRDTLRIRKGAS